MAAKKIALQNDNEQSLSVQMFLGETVLCEAANVTRQNILAKVKSETKTSETNGISRQGTLRRDNKSEAHAKFTRQNSLAKDTKGTLYITNFKVAFTCCVKTEEYDRECDVFYCAEFIPLTSIAKLYAISTSKNEKRKRLKSAKKELKSHYDMLEVVTKDFRVIRFDLKSCPSKSTREECFRVISHYAFPTSVARLFAFDYGRNALNSDRHAFNSFKHRKDFEINLHRLNTIEKWRVSNVNNDFELSKTLPRYITCPTSITEDQLTDLAKFYEDARIPVLCWCHPETGASLLVSSQFSSQESHVKAHPQFFLKTLKESTSEIERSINIDLSTDFLNVKDLQASFKKLTNLLTKKDFWTHDSSWLTNLEETSWLNCVSKCLEKAVEVVHYLTNDHCNVILRGSSGRDFSILIASLVQILLDPYYRTHVGLQSLIQQDWVVFGHPFSSRLGAVPEEATSEQSPVFLLFLDCLFQIMDQHQLSFEYMDNYLILLMDLAHSSLFDTFLFNCEKAHDEEPSKLVSAWDFIDTYIPPTKFDSFFTNLAYHLEEDTPHLEVRYKMFHLSFWSAYFNRWFTRSVVKKNSSIALHITQRRFFQEVQSMEESHAKLQHQLHEDGAPKTKTKRRPSIRFSMEDSDEFSNLLENFQFLNII